MSNVDYEGVSLDLDTAKLREAATRLPDWVHRVLGGMELENVIASIPGTTGEFADEAFEIDDGTGSLNLVQALVIAAATATELSDTEHEGTLSVETDEVPLAVVHGSLTVRGDLNLHTGMLVLGDLRVTGRLRDLEPYSRLIVVGNLHATTIWSRSPIWVSGTVDAKVVHLCYHGQVFVGDTLRADLVLESAESRGVDGDVDARAHSPASSWQASARGALDELRETIVPEAYVEDDERDAFDPERLLAMAEAGQTFLVGE